MTVFHFRTWRIAARVLHTAERAAGYLSDKLEALRIHLYWIAHDMDPTMNGAPPAEPGFIWRPTYIMGRVEPLWRKHPIFEGRRSVTQQRHTASGGGHR